MPCGNLWIVNSEKVRRPLGIVKEHRASRSCALRRGAYPRAIRSTCERRRLDRVTWWDRGYRCRSERDLASVQGERRGAEAQAASADAGKRAAD